MGMAASQARFLGLTARKSNTEYECQTSLLTIITSC